MQGSSCVCSLACDFRVEIVPYHVIVCVGKGYGKYLAYLNPLCNYAWELIDNYILNQNKAEVTEGSMILHNEYKHLSVLTHAQCVRRVSWDCSNKQQYKQYKCRTSGWDKTILIFCSCSVGERMWKDCYGQHRGEATKFLGMVVINYLFFLIIAIFHVR